MAPTENDTLVVDKTGTLTEGKPAVTRIIPAPGFNEDEVLRLAASVEQASEHELANAAARADRTGMYCCPQTGVALAVLFKLAERGVIKSKDRVVVISTAHGLKFTQFKTGYHEDTLSEVEALAANPPVYLPADAQVVRQTIERRLEQRA